MSKDKIEIGSEVVMLNGLAMGKKGVVESIHQGEHGPHMVAIVKINEEDTMGWGGITIAARLENVVLSLKVN